MREIEVRSALVQYLSGIAVGDHNPLVIHELELCQGAARIDVAVIDNALIGYEIKSEQDTLERLPRQIQAYGKSLEFVTLVCGSRHLSKAQELIPSWWGVLEARAACNTSSTVELVSHREARSNLNVDTFSIAQLLWRDEALAILDGAGLSAGLKSKPRLHLWRKLAEVFLAEDLSYLVQNTLRSRTNWRAAPQPQLCGD